MPGGAVIVDAHEDRNLSFEFGDSGAHFVTANCFRIGWSGIFQIDHDRVRSTRQHLPKEVGADGGSEEQRSKASGQHERHRTAPG